MARVALLVRWMPRNGGLAMSAGMVPRARIPDGGMGSMARAAAGAAFARRQVFAARGFCASGSHQHQQSVGTGYLGPWQGYEDQPGASDLRSEHSAEGSSSVDGDAEQCTVASGDDAETHSASETATFPVHLAQHPPASPQPPTSSKIVDEEADVISGDVEVLGSSSAAHRVMSDASHSFPIGAENHVPWRTSIDTPTATSAESSEESEVPSQMQDALAHMGMPSCKTLKEARTLLGTIPPTEAQLQWLRENASLTNDRMPQTFIQAIDTMVSMSGQQALSESVPTPPLQSVDSSQMNSATPLSLGGSESARAQAIVPPPRQPQQPYVPYPTQQLPQQQPVSQFTSYPAQQQDAPNPADLFGAPVRPPMTSPDGPPTERQREFLMRMGVDINAIHTKQQASNEIERQIQSQNAARLAEKDGGASTRMNDELHEQQEKLLFGAFGFWGCKFISARAVKTWELEPVSEKQRALIVALAGSTQDLDKAVVTKGQATKLITVLKFFREAARGASSGTLSPPQPAYSSDPFSKLR
ncbi:hypothetical protein FVE85_7269 [Porphyridium purpureum]|uniref:Uncharacterized protein n=1 Tax=Porphyridium purpureum TaxID=35688 RepID=A0A5J4Z9K9_PORPP|nr:hypothetical protein FVE85_7269 [Porphyridium purpureum]|eukprot:POR0597..scf295_1